MASSTLASEVAPGHIARVTARKKSSPVKGTDGSPFETVLSRVDERIAGAPPPDVIPSGFPSVDRLLSGGVRAGGLDELRRGTLDDGTRASVGAAAARLRSIPLRIERMPLVAERLVTDIQSRDGAQLVVVDPLQMLAAGGSSLDQELATAVRQLKHVAVDADVA